MLKFNSIPLIFRRYSSLKSSIPKNRMPLSATSNRMPLSATSNRMPLSATSSHSKITHFSTQTSTEKSAPKKRARKALITLTDSAKVRLKELGAGGKLRIATKQKGCSGLSYALEYVEKPAPFDEVVVDGDVTVFVDSKSIMHLIGSVVDFKSSPLSSGFTFNNPNIKEECGCGESFSV